MWNLWISSQQSSCDQHKPAKYPSYHTKSLEIIRLTQGHNLWYFRGVGQNENLIFDKNFDKNQNGCRKFRGVSCPVAFPRGCGPGLTWCLPAIPISNPPTSDRMAFDFALAEPILTHFSPKTVIMIPMKPKPIDTMTRMRQTCRKSETENHSIARHCLKRFAFYCTLCSFFAVRFAPRGGSKSTASLGLITYFAYSLYSTKWSIIYVKYKHKV